ncbi:hypothetical protein ACVIJ6_001209 [Bradyrhizobium sp. USDA 4369]
MAVTEIVTADEHRRSPRMRILLAGILERQAGTAEGRTDKWLSRICLSGL